MLKKLSLLCFGLAIIPALAQAQDLPPHDEPCPDGHCEVKTKTECFNVVCYYKALDRKSPIQNCKAAATFDKDVTLQGGEVRDDSNYRNHPAFSVSCDDLPAFYDNSAHRYTTLLGTRIQGQGGPRPAMHLPRGALHSGADDTSGPHVVSSVLDIEVGNLGGRTARLSGSCEIWTGNP